MLVILFLGLFSNSTYAQETQIFLVDMDSVLIHSSLGNIKKDLRDTFYHKNHQRLIEGVKQFQQEVTAYSQHNCCGCTPERQQRQIDRLKAMQEHLEKQEEGLLQIDSLLELQFKSFAFEVCAELTEQYMKRNGMKGLVLDTSQLGILSSLGVGYLTKEVVQLVDSTDVYNARLRTLEQSFTELVEQLFMVE